MNILFYLLLLISFFQVPIVHCMEMEGPSSKQEESLEEMQFVGPFAPFIDKTAELIALLQKNAPLEEFMPLFDEGFIRDAKHTIETRFGPIQVNALMASILFNRTDVFEKLLQYWGLPFIDMRNNKGQTALMLAVAMGSKPIIEQLLSVGASIGTTDSDGRSVVQYTDSQNLVTELESYKNPLAHAVENSDIAAVKKIVMANPYFVNQADSTGKTPFDYAIDKQPNDLALPMLWNVKNPRSLELALVKMIDADNAIIVDRLLRIANEHYPQLYFLPLTQINTTALIYAIQKKKTVMAAKIIEEFLRQLATENKKLTTQYQSEYVKQLIYDKLINFLNYKDTVGQTALMYAIKQKDLPLIEMLLNTNKAYLKPQDKTGLTAVTYAIKSGDPAIWHAIFGSNMFKKQASAILIQDQEGKVPLMYAIELQYPNLINFLFGVYKEKKFGFMLQDQYGKTILIYSIINADPTDDSSGLTGALLVSQPALVNVADKAGKTPLMYAIEKDKPRLVQAILNNFPNTDAKDIRGFGVLDYVHGMLEADYPNAREIAGLVGDYILLEEQKAEIPGRPVKKKRRTSE